MKIKFTVNSWEYETGHETFIIDTEKHTGMITGSPKSGIEIIDIGLIENEQANPADEDKPCQHPLSSIRPVRICHICGENLDHR